MKTRPLITYKEHFFRKGDKVRVMWNKELKDLGYKPFFNEYGDLMDDTLINVIMVADEINSPCSDTDLKILSVASAFLAKQME